MLNKTRRAYVAWMHARVNTIDIRGHHNVIKMKRVYFVITQLRVPKCYR